MSDALDHERMDRTQFRVTTLQQQDEESRAYWQKQSPEQRMEALERLRMIHCAYDPSTSRLQRVFRVLEP